MMDTTSDHGHCLRSWTLPQIWSTALSDGLKEDRVLILFIRDRYPVLLCTCVMDICQLSPPASSESAGFSIPILFRTIS